MAKHNLKHRCQFEEYLANIPQRQHQSTSLTACMRSLRPVQSRHDVTYLDDSCTDVQVVLGSSKCSPDVRLLLDYTSHMSHKQPINELEAAFADHCHYRQHERHIVMQLSQPLIKTDLVSPWLH